MSGSLYTVWCWFNGGSGFAGLCCFLCGATWVSCFPSMEGEAFASVHSTLSDKVRWKRIFSDLAFGLMYMFSNGFTACKTMHLVNV